MPQVTFICIILTSYTHFLLASSSSFHRHEVDSLCPSNTLATPPPFSLVRVQLTFCKNFTSLLVMLVRALLSATTLVPIFHVLDITLCNPIPTVSASCYSLLPHPVRLVSPFD
ncbi:hypothetical protein H4582DRAFT_2028523 [Lactarius indigo]|nr:hypothetical protein H4582DRAFT_2028523 [Lactarius indigo]